IYTFQLRIKILCYFSVQSSKMNPSSHRALLPHRVSETSRYGFATPQSVFRPGTSERITSSFGRRTSSIGTCGGMEKIKDPRPLHDKAFVQQCIRQLCEFLGEYSYPHSISTKSLQSPTAKEFLKIFSFLYNLLDQSYQMPDSKFEEEIPRIFKSLGYPFPLSKSSMYTVGAPHTWPLILGALVWLMDQIKLLKSVDPDKILFGADKDWDGVENVTNDGVHNNRAFKDELINQLWDSEANFSLEVGGNMELTTTWLVMTNSVDAFKGRTR
ncbi:hypothetical protein scyTo_0017279, partial [Scyliorhinus torazame]|nr:hypothetical protein [Scyliorhinus torazame]